MRDFLLELVLVYFVWKRLYPVLQKVTSPLPIHSLYKQKAQSINFRMGEVFGGLVCRPQSARMLPFPQCD